MRPKDQDVVPAGVDPDGSYAVIETDDDEIIVLEGSSQAEVDAKLDDFLTWAS